MSERTEPGTVDADTSETLILISLCCVAGLLLQTLWLASGNIWPRGSRSRGDPVAGWWLVACRVPITLLGGFAMTSIGLRLVRFRRAPAPRDSTVGDARSVRSVLPRPGRVSVRRAHDREVGLRAADVGWSPDRNVQGRAALARLFHGGDDTGNPPGAPLPGEDVRGSAPTWFPPGLHGPSSPFTSS